MLEVSQLTRRYNHFKAVDNVSFTIGQGEIVGLLGHNGAGKTTIMKMISGCLEPDQGLIRVDGINLATEPRKVQANLGYLPENLPVYPEMTVADYLDYMAQLQGLSHGLKISEIKRVIAATEIAEKLSAPIATLSRGYKQRVGVAQAVLGHPKLLILDEPTNGLDPSQTQHMRELIRTIAREATVILSTHIMQEVDVLCSRVLILRSGQLAVDAELQTLRQTNHLLLETSLPIEQMGSVQKKVGGIKAVMPITATPGDADQGYTDRFKYRIELCAEDNHYAIRTRLAKTIINLDQALFLLQPEYNDLETLFRKVNEDNYQQENLHHAA